MSRRTVPRDELSPQGRQTLARYADRGWFNAAGDDRLRDDFSRGQLPRPAYLVIASGMRILLSSEVQVTTRCNYRPFRATQLVVMSDEARRFDLLDLKVVHRSQFRRAEVLSLRACVEEATPELIRWPMEVCGPSDEFVVRAIIPTQDAASSKDDPGARFEMLLIGEVC
jgi:hypothetical protein